MLERNKEEFDSSSFKVKGKIGISVVLGRISYMFEAGCILSQQPAKAEPVYENWDKLLDFEIYIIYLPVSNVMPLFHSDNLKTSDSPIP